MLNHQLELFRVGQSILAYQNKGDTISVSIIKEETRKAHSIFMNHQHLYQNITRVSSNSPNTKRQNYKISNLFSNFIPN